MGAALCFDDFAERRHYLIVRRWRAFVVKRSLNFRSEPYVVRLGFFNRGELGLNR